MSSGQGVKRKNVGDDLTGRKKKKQKMDLARTILVQSSSMASNSGNGAVKGVHFPSDP
jgi:hypothetical protein